jgi:hypothetical protein
MSDHDGLEEVIAMRGMRNVGPTPASRSQVRTVVAETMNPRPFISPTMR